MMRNVIVDIRSRKFSGVFCVCEEKFVIEWRGFLICCILFIVKSVIYCCICICLNIICVKFFFIGFVLVF